VAQRNIRQLSLQELEQYFESIGEKKFRISQLREWLWQKHAHSFADMTNLSKDLRQQLGDNFSLPVLTIDALEYMV
jgi:23S rRNA (adenine2503-C2)-methyltransferase